MRKIIVDIDNTLWDLAPVLYEHIRAVAPTIPLPAEWHQWDFWKGYISEKAVYGILRDIHMQPGCSSASTPMRGKFLSRSQKKRVLYHYCQPSGKGHSRCNGRMAEKASASL